MGRQGVRRQFGAYAAGIATGVQVRHDQGRQSMSAALQAELRFLGMMSSPAFVRTPEATGSRNGSSGRAREQVLGSADIQHHRESPRGPPCLAGHIQRTVLQPCPRNQGAVRASTISKGSPCAGICQVSTIRVVPALRSKNIIHHFICTSKKYKAFSIH